MSEPWLPAEHGRDNGGLQRRVARGLTWTIVDIWGKQALNLVVFIVLARLLVPDDFGLVALAGVFVALAQLLVDQGLGDALIQRREVTRSHIDTAFWVAVATGSLLAAGGIVLAIPIAAALRQPALQPILQVLSLTLVLAAPTSIQIALLRRELAFRSLAMRAIAAAAGGGAVGVTLAFLGFGAWALVGQQLAGAALSVLILWRVTPWRPSRQFSAKHFRELFSFGINVVGSDILAFFSRNSDNLLIGVVLGTTPLGFYAVAYRIMEVSQTALVNIARRITFPAFSRLQHDHSRMRSAYFRVTRVAGVVILPTYLALALIAPELTVAVFGARWAQSGSVAAILFLIGPVLAVGAFNDSLLNAAGHPEVVLRFRFITTVVNVLGFLIAVPFGIPVVAAAFVVRGYLLTPLILRWMRIYAQIPAGEYLRQQRSTTVATLVMVASVLALKLGLAQHLNATPLAVAEIAVAVLSFSVALRLIDRDLVREVGDLARQALGGAGRAPVTLPS
jgi:O-antigen/teichoic acid export membrane protein